MTQFCKRLIGELKIMSKGVKVNGNSFQKMEKKREGERERERESIFHLSLINRYR